MPAGNRSVVVIENRKNSGLAAVLSFFWCGLGQIYNGQILKGAGLFLVYPIFAWFGCASTLVGVLGGIAASTPGGQAAAGGFGAVGAILLLFALALWLYGMINAYRRLTLLIGDRHRPSTGSGSAVFSETRDSLNAQCSGPAPHRTLRAWGANVPF